MVTFHHYAPIGITLLALPFKYARVRPNKQKVRRMRIVLLATAFALLAGSASAKVILNSFDENGSAKKREAMREEAIAKGEEVPLEAQEYQPPQNAWAATWAAAQARVNQAVAGTEQSFQENKVAAAKKDLRKAEKKGNAEAISAAKAKLEAEEAKLVEVTQTKYNYKTSATDHWGTAKDFTQNAMTPKNGYEQPIAGFDKLGKQEEE